MWVLDYLDDLESDFSAIHRIEDMYELDGPRFFSLAMRLAAYPGVMQVRASEQDEKRRKKYGDSQVEHRSLDELQKVKGGDSLFEREIVEGS